MVQKSRESDSLEVSENPHPPLSQGSSEIDTPSYAYAPIEVAFSKASCSQHLMGDATCGAPAMTA